MGDGDCPMPSSFLHYPNAQNVAKMANVCSGARFMPTWHDWLKDEEKQKVAEIYAARGRLRARDRETTMAITRIMNAAVRRM